MRPIPLSDDEMNHIYAATQPLAPDKRAGFLEALAAELQGREIGPGSVGRAIALVQRQFFDPPLEADPGSRARRRVGIGKYA
jgi:hypothetical protein